MEFQMTYAISKSDALLIIDPQNDFCSGGPLAVPGGDEIMRPIGELAGRFRQAGALVVITQDWHPADHDSFASSHDGGTPFGTVELAYGTQVLWPDHCVEGRQGAEFHDDLAAAGGVDAAAVIIRKGRQRAVDSYSAFYENDKVTTTGLGGYLAAMGVKRVFLVGLAYDFCVAYSAIDAVEREALTAIVLKDLTRAIRMPFPKGESGPASTVELMEDEFQRLGVEIGGSDEVERVPDLAACLA
jgi:nicotinamidase/pyrazinamidase